MVVVGLAGGGHNGRGADSPVWETTGSKASGPNSIRATTTGRVWEGDPNWRQSGEHMTVVFTAISHRFLLMAADSAVQLDYGETREYQTGRKFWWIPRIGGVSTWGARDANQIGHFLSKEWEDPAGRSVDDLARDVHAFLVRDYAPDDMALGDVGFHIAGFRQGGEPALYHSFWNTLETPIAKASTPYNCSGRNAPTPDSCTMAEMISRSM